MCLPVWEGAHSQIVLLGGRLNNPNTSRGVFSEETTMPEITVQPKTEEQQLAGLREFLASCEPFRVCRGRLGSGDWSNVGIFTDHESTPERPLLFTTPSAILRELERRHGQTRVMMNALAKYQRDGQHRAFQELMYALTDRNYVITGESLDLSLRTPGVLMIYQPKRILTLLRWLKMVNPVLMDLHQGQLDERERFYIEKGFIKDRPRLAELTAQVLQENPAIREGFEKYYEARRGDPRIGRQELRHFVPQSLFPHHDKTWGILKTLAVDDDGASSLSDTTWLAVEEDGSGNDILGNWGIACFYPGKTQKEVLSRFKRKHHGDIATWQFHYPAHIHSCDTHNFSIGLFPENEHARFHRQWPSYTSPSLQQGMGAVMLEPTWRRKIKMEDPIFDQKHWREREDDPDPLSIGMHLHFRRN